MTQRQTEKRLQKRAGIVLTRTKDATDEILIVHGRQHNKWSLPKGHVELGESKEECAHRELREETGVVLTPEDEYKGWAEIDKVSLYFYHTHRDIPLTGEVDSREVTKAEWVPFNKVGSLELNQSLKSWFERRDKIKPIKGKLENSGIVLMNAKDEVLLSFGGIHTKWSLPQCVVHSEVCGKVIDCQGGVAVQTYAHLALLETAGIELSPEDTWKGEVAVQGCHGVNYTYLVYQTDRDIPLPTENASDWVKFSRWVPIHKLDSLSKNVALTAYNDSHFKASKERKIKIVSIHEEGFTTVSKRRVKK